MEGFSLEATRHVHENDREGLERLLRYGARPPLAMERLSRREDGQLVLRFKKALADGSSHVVLSPLELMRRLAGLVAAPGFHLLTYHGVFAARAKVRARIAPPPAPSPEHPPDVPAPPPDFIASEPNLRYLPWAELLRRTRGLDVLRCVSCGGRMELVAVVTDPALAQEILDHLRPASSSQGPPS